MMPVGRTPSPRLPKPVRNAIAVCGAVRAIVRSTLLLLAVAPSAWAVEPPAWTATWTASPQPTWQADFPFPTNLPTTLADRTLRQVARVSIGGDRIRLVLSNAYGRQPLHVGHVRVALAADPSTTVPGSDRAVTFDGSRAATVPPGAPLLSDPIDLPVAARDRVTVSIYLPAAIPLDTFHWDGRQTATLAPGDQTDAVALAEATTTTARMLLSGIQVDAPTATGAVVVLGDSITDGNGATVDADTRWPDFLAARLAPRGVAVVNAGISGARLLSDRMGVNALARFERDVLAQPGVRSVIVMLGINDISWPGTAFDPTGTMPPAAALIGAYRQLIARARARGVRVVGTTLTPFEGALTGTPLADYWQPAKDAMRADINRWIRGSGEFDAVLDADAVLRDPRHPGRLRADLDSGDHLHPGDRGNAALADAVDLDRL